MHRITRLDLFEVWRQNDAVKRSNEMCQYVLNKCKLEDCPGDILHSIKHTISIIYAKINAKWEKHGRNAKRFLAANSDWLEQVVNFEELVNSHLKNKESTKPKTIKNAECLRRGRPPKSFSALGDRAKRQRTEDLRSTVPAEELYFATRSQLYKEGH